MTLDHIGYLFVPITTPLGTTLRVVGRITAPLMCFFLVEGFSHTRSKGKYALRLFIFALISQIPYCYMIYDRFRIDDLNVIFTLLFSFLMMLCLEKIGNPFLKILSVLPLYFLCQYCDWGLMMPLWIIFFYIFRDDKKKQYLWYFLLCCFWVIRCCSKSAQEYGQWYDSLWQAGSFLALPLIMSYDAKAVKSSKFDKWFFYIYYPLHLLVLTFIARNI